MIRTLSVVIVSHNARPFLRSALRSLQAHAGPVDFEVILVDNGTDGAADLVSSEFPETRVLRCANHGFAHANNVALRTIGSRYVLFLNPDTEILEGRLSDLIARLDTQPDVGLASVNQVMPNGRRWPTIKRYPSPFRTFAEAFGAERLPLRLGCLGERELRSAPYERETSCDWVAGSFMLVRREALESAGWLDERFFLYSEETDFCLRIRMAGWDIRHLPTMTVLHHESVGPGDPRFEGQLVFARLQYAAKHFSRARRMLFRLALVLRYSLRVPMAAWRREHRDGRRRAVIAGLDAALGRARPPFIEPPPAAVTPSGGKRAQLSRVPER